MANLLFVYFYWSIGTVRVKSVQVKPVPAWNRQIGTGNCTELADWNQYQRRTNRLVLEAGNIGARHPMNQEPVALGTQGTRS